MIMETKTLSGTAIVGTELITEEKKLNELPDEKKIRYERRTNDLKSAINNPLMVNVPGALSNLPAAGTVAYMPGPSDFGTKAHIQGMGIYLNYLLLTPNR